MPSAILDQLGTYGPDRCDRLDFSAASDYTRRLAQSQYENFTVVSWLLPRRLRDDFRHVYAFCRWADDLGDETGDPAKSIQLLDWWRRELDLCYAGQPRHPVFVALLHTIRAHDIPRQPFDHLIDAFIQDQRVTRYDTFDQVLDYCTRSANPVGRLVLYLCGFRDEQRQQLSDATCTALQLANFWQDVRRDILERDRVYVPHDIATRHNLDIATMVAAVRVDAGLAPAPDFRGQREGRGEGGAHGTPCVSESCCNGSKIPSAGITALLPAYRATLKDLTDRTRPLFRHGRALWPLMPRDVRVDIQLFSLGGESILRMIEKQNYDTLSHRPSLSKPAKLRLFLRALTGKMFSWTSTSGTGGAT